MIAGEHAVLHGHHALVAAVDQRVTVKLTPRGDNTITIDSALGQRTMRHDAIDASQPFHFLGAVLEENRPELPGGCDIVIEADFPPDVGLGSSAAITVAALAAVKTWTTGTFPSNNELMNMAVGLIRKVQGSGSGSDATASVRGGALLYKATPQVVSRVDEPLPPIVLVYGGYKTPTPEVIRIVEAQRAEAEDNYASLFERINACSLAAAESMKSGEWPVLGATLDIGQMLMEELGVCDETLGDIVSRMKDNPGIMGAKISGSGLGDCVLGIGALNAVDWPYRVIPVELSPDGVRLEEM